MSKKNLWRHSNERLQEFVVTGICVATIVAGAIFGTWALLVTMSF